MFANYDSIKIKIQDLAFEFLLKKVIGRTV